MEYNKDDQKIISNFNNNYNKNHVYKYHNETQIQNSFNSTNKIKKIYDSDLEKINRNWNFRIVKIHFSASFLFIWCKVFICFDLDF